HKGFDVEGRCYMAEAICDQPHVRRNAKGCSKIRIITKAGDPGRHVLKVVVNDLEIITRSSNAVGSCAGTGAFKGVVDEFTVIGVSRDDVLLIVVKGVSFEKHRL